MYKGVYVLYVCGGQSNGVSGCKKLFSLLSFMALTYQNVVCQILEIGFHFTRSAAEKERERESGDSRKAVCTFPFIRGALSSYIAYYKPRQIDSSQALHDVLRILKIAAAHNVCNKNECDFLLPFNVSSRYRFFSLSFWVCHTKSLINSQMALSISLYRLRKIQFFM